MNDALFDMDPVVEPELPKNKRKAAKTYAEFVAAAEPAFQRAADSGRPFTSFEIAEREHLLDPPKPRSQWGGFISGLKARGVITHHGWDNSHRPGDNGSGVKTWAGTPQPQRGTAWQLSNPPQITQRQE